MRSRKVKIDHKNVMPYSKLSKEQKLRHHQVSNYVIAYCLKNKNKYIPWQNIDNQIPHLYSFVFDSYNNSHQKTKLIFDDIGVKIVDVL